MAEMKYLQSLMDSAYDRWKSDEDVKSYRDMLEAASEVERKAVVIGNLNYQVENGGFSQWAFNGYLDDGSEVLMPFFSELEQSGEVPLSTTVRELVSKAVIIHEEASSAPDWCECWEEDLDEWGGCQCGYEDGEYAWDQMDEADSAYYSINQAFLAQVEAYLLRKAGEEVPVELVEAGEYRGKLPEVVKVKPKVNLIGKNGNALNVVHLCRRALKKAGYSSEELDAFKEEALSGNYQQVLQTAMKWCDVR